MAEQQLIAILGADVSQFQKAMKNVQGSLNDTTDNLNKSMHGAEGDVKKGTNKMSESFKKLGLVIATVFAIDKIIDFGKFAVNATAEMDAMNAQFEQVFGDMGDIAQKNIDNLGRQFGMLPNRIKPAMSSMTSMFKGLGLDTETAMQTASDAVTLVADAAAFYDKSFEDANSALNSFIKGNYEGGESIGLFANETQLATWASDNLGLSWKTLDEAGKQVARLEYAKAMQESAGATGQATRESDNLQNVLGNLQQAWTDFSAVLAKPILPIVVEAMKGLITVLQGATTWVDNFYESFGETSILEKFSETFQQIKSDILSGDFSDIANIIPQMLESFANQGGSFSGIGANLVHKIADGMGKSVPELMNMVVEVVGAIIEGFIKSIPMVLETGVLMIEGLIDGIVKTIPLLLSSATSILGSLIETIVGILPKIIQLGVRLLSSLIEGIVEALPLLIEGITQLISSLITIIVDNLPMVLEAGVMLLETLINGIMDNLSLLVDAITTVLTTLVEYITDNLPMILEAGIELVVTLIEGILESLPEMVNTILDLVLLIVRVILENLPAIIEAGIEILKAVIDGIIDMLPELIACAIELIFAIQKALLDNLPLILRAGVEVMFALIDGIIEMLPEIMDAIDEVIEAVLLGFAEVDWKSIGKDILDGIVAGIKANVGTVLGTVEGIANSLLKAGKKVLQIGSPSKKFEEEVGKAIPTGIAEGVKKESDVALNAVEEMGNKLTVQGINSNFGRNLNNLPRVGANNNRNFENIFNISSLVVREEADLQKLATQLVKEMARQEQQLNRAGGRVQYGY